MSILVPPVAQAPSRANGGPVDDDRLNRNAMSLVAGSVVTSLLGFAFWILAARTMSTAAVGTGTAFVAALVLLGNMSTLGLRNALPRFLPTMSSATGRFIGWSYAAATATAVAVGTVFVLGADFWASELVGLRDNLLTQVLFVVAVAGWAVFVLQDSVLIGLRTATWVPVENLAYALAKLMLLLAIASVGSLALPIAWIVPAVAILVPLNVMIFRRLVPTAAHSRPMSTELEWRPVARFAAGDHFADIVRFLGAEGVVLIVLAHLGPESSGPLFFAITIAASLQLVSSNVMSAFVAEAAKRPGQADALLIRATGQITALIVPGALVAFAGAPLGLALFGQEFVDSGTTVLRLLLLAAIPQIALSLAIGLARYRRRMPHVLALTIGAAAGPIVGASVLVPRFGIVAVGWSMLIGNTILAVVLLATTLRSLVGSLPSATFEALLSMRLKIRQRRRFRAAATVFDELDSTRGDGAPLWPRKVIATEGDVVVAKVAGGSDLIVKVALSPEASRGLQRHATSTTAMRAATAGSLAQKLVPETLEIGTCLGQTYVVESACKGQSLDVLDAASMQSIAAALGDLHRATARPRRPEDDLVYTAVTVPCRVLQADPRLSEYRSVIDALATSLWQALTSRAIIVSRTHGDSWRGNVLVDSRFDPPVVTGVVDWENSEEVGLPEIDIAHLWLSEYPTGIAAGTLSAMVAGQISDLLGPTGRDLQNPRLPAAVVVTLAWLAHVSAGLERSSRFALGHFWLSRTVTPVLDLLEEVGPEQVIRS